MKYKHLLLISALLVQSSAVWAMDANEDMEKRVTSHKLTIKSDGNLTIIAPEVSLNEQISIKGRIICGGNFNISGKDLYFDGTTICSGGDLMITASGSLLLENVSLEAKETLFLKGTKRI